jgi:hypothetical protein
MGPIVSGLSDIVEDCSSGVRKILEKKFDFSVNGGCRCSVYSDASVIERSL